MPKLTDRSLAALKVENGRKDRLVFDTACPGLGVRVTAKGTRTFIAQWTDSATRRKIREPLGVWGNLTIEQARCGAGKARRHRQGGRSEGRAAPPAGRSRARARRDGADL